MLWLYSDPPLEEEDVPKGEWLCHKCKAEMAVAEAASSSNSRVVINAFAPVGIPELGGLSEHPLQTLARAARMMNPGQMNLEKSFMPHIQLPGKYFIYTSYNSCQVSLFFAPSMHLLRKLFENLLEVDENLLLIYKM